jgi:hypothetical protein
MASLLTNASDIHDGNVQDAVAQITGNTSAAAAAQKEADDAYYRAPREDPNEEIVLGFYNNFIKLKNKWSNKRNRDDDFVEEISDAVYKYEEWKNSVRPDGDSNFGNPKYDRRYKRWNTKFANFLKKVRPRNYNSYSPEEKVEYRDLKGKKPKSFYTVLNNLVTKLDQESQQWYPSDSDSSSGGGRRRKKRGGDQGNAPVTFIVSNDNIAITQFNENIKARQDIDLTFIKGNSKDGRDAIVYEMRNSGLIGGWFIIKYDPNSENNAQFGHWKRNAFVDDEYPEQANEIIAEDNIKIGDRFVIQTPDQIGGKRRRKTRKMKGGHHLYKRLGVSKYSSQKQIKKAYNKLKKKKKLTKKVKYAYKILSKKKSRKKYNAKYKKMKKKKRTKRRNKGGMSSMVIKGQSFPSGFMPVFDIPDTSSLNAPAWMSQL